MVDLPRPIATYLAANARLDAEGMLSAFAANAVVKDEGAERHGLGAIEAWLQSATIGVRAIFRPDSWRREGDAIVLEGPTAGDFPGSPIRFCFYVWLKDDKIVRLKIVQE